MFNGMATDYGASINYQNARSIYPTMAGPSTGSEAGASNNSGLDPAADNPNGAAGAIQSSLEVGAKGSPIATIIGLAVLTVFLMWAAQRWGSEGAAFSNIKLTAYNVTIIGLAAVVFIVTAKTVFTYIKVPGISTVIHAV